MTATATRSRASEGPQAPVRPDPVRDARPVDQAERRHAAGDQQEEGHAAPTSWGSGSGSPYPTARDCHRPGRLCRATARAIASFSRCWASPYAAKSPLLKRVLAGVEVGWMSASAAFSAAVWPPGVVGGVATEQGGPVVGVVHTVPARRPGDRSRVAAEQRVERAVQVSDHASLSPNAMMMARVQRIGRLAPGLT